MQRLRLSCSRLKVVYVGKKEASAIITKRAGLLVVGRKRGGSGWQLLVAFG